MINYFSSLKLEDTITMWYFKCSFDCGTIFVSIHIHNMITLFLLSSLLPVHETLDRSLSLLPILLEVGIEFKGNMIYINHMLIIMNYRNIHSCLESMCKNLVACLSSKRIVSASTFLCNVFLKNSPSYSQRQKTLKNKLRFRFLTCDQFGKLDAS